jgi:hypothetical protein
MPASAEVVIAIDPWADVPIDEMLEPLPTSGVIPARSQAVGRPPAVAIRFDWDDYQTLVVVGPDVGKAHRTSAWVVTYTPEGKVTVAYRAAAFRDAAGLIHIDARRAIITGPMADDWSPDSFAIAPDGTVYAIDDQNRTNTGKVIERIEASSPAYREVMAVAVATVRESS